MEKGRLFGLKYRQFERPSVFHHVMITLSKFMFDINIFDKILKMDAPSDLLVGKHQYFVTRIQKDELEALNNERLRNQPMSIFQMIPQEPVRARPR